MFPYQNTKIPNFAKTKKLISKGIDIFIFHKSSQFYDILTHNCIVFWCTSRTIRNREQRRKFISWLEINVRARNRGLQSGMELKGGG